MSKKLLLADDSVVIQKLIGLSFANENIEIVSTDNGDDAIEVAREFRPDVILADVVMPGKSGYEVCEAIKQDPSLSHVPVLLLTGTFEAFDEARASSVGANGQITKPFEAQALVERVKAAMAAVVIVETPAAPLPVEVPAVTVSPAFTSSGPIEVSEKNAGASPTTLGANGFDSNVELDAPIVNELPPVAVEDFLGEGRDSLSDFSDRDPGDAHATARVDRLATEMGGDGVGLDLTPELSPQFGLADPNEVTAPALLDTLSEGANNAIDTEGETHSLGQWVTGASKSEGERAIVDFSGTPEASTLPPAFAPATRNTPEASSLSFSDGPLDDLGLDESFLSEGLPEARPVMSDATLGSVGNDGEPTPWVAQDDRNAGTSPNLAPLADLTEVPGVTEAVDTPNTVSALEDRSVHSPTSDIDQFSNRVDAPNTIDSRSDASFYEDALTAEFASVADLDESLAVGLLNPLGLGPASVSADELDFAFDVSEQVAAESSFEVSNSAGESVSSVTDISDSPILGDRSGEAEIPPATSSPAETIAVGYDVSASDLATARSTPEPGGIAAPPPLPETEPLYEIPDLSRTEQSTTPAGFDENLFDGLVTGSVLDEMPITTQAENDENLDSREDLIEVPLGSSAFDPAPVPDLSTLSAIEIGDDPFGAGRDSTLSSEPQNDSEDFIAGLSQPRANAEVQVPDMSPLMEQQIKETLEKVAWEAFSDLSESIVKQVMGRVEQIAWEVIPEMAETLVREEIRKMKGEDE